MTYYTEKKAIKSIVPFLVAKAESEGLTAVKFPYGKTIRMMSLVEKDNKEIEHKVTVSASYSSYTGNKAFNKSIGDYWQGAGSATTVNSITYDFGVNNATIVNAYSIQAIIGDRRTLCTNAPKKWTLFGATDDLGTNTVWTPLDMRDGITDWRFQAKRFFKFSNTTPYRQYKLEVTLTNGAVLCIGQLEFYNMADLTQKPEQISAAYLVSNGTGTFDKVNLYVDSGDCYNNDFTKPYFGNALYVGTVESFDPVTWEHRNMMLDIYYLSRTTTPYQNNNNIFVNLYAEISKDRILFATVMDTSAVYPANNAAYIGLMKRYSNEGNNGGLVNAVGMQFLYGQPAVMRNKSGSYYQQITARTVTLGYSPSVWGDNVFVSPVFLEGDYEGIRGELEGVYTARIDNVVNEDEILIGSVRYKAIVITSYGNCAFPNNCVVFKIPNATPTQ